MYTPKRKTRLMTDDRLTEMLDSSPVHDSFYPTYYWGDEVRNVQALSPGSSCSSPECKDVTLLVNTCINAVGGSGSSGSCPGIVGGNIESHRRGRPRADALSNLMMQGSTSPSNIKCTYCSRVFPREKSLQAHLRTHTGG